jgi:TonB family protein
MKIRKWRTSTRRALLLTLIWVALSAGLQSQASSEGVRKVVARVAPQYPVLARNMNIRGNVKVEILVEPNGTAKSVAIRGGHPILAQAAQDAVRRWKWETLPHPTTELVEIRFSPQ